VTPDAPRVAEHVRAALVRTALAAYEDAAVRGLCAEGAWEVAVTALRQLDLSEALRPPERTCEDPMLKIVEQSVELPAPPAALYSMYLDAGRHAAFTGGGPVSISAAADTAWSAFEGRIHGRVLALTPDRRIVQSWRSFEWHDDDPDSVLILTFLPSDSGTRLELAQVDVPARLQDTLLSGWPSRYWEPWRAYLQHAR
jgi:uncharacterized protein YndB with AHSA1/START domain